MQNTLAELNEVLREELLAKMLNRKQSTLKKYLVRPDKIPTPVTDRMNFLSAVIRNRSVVHGNRAIREWLEQEHPKLKGKRPVDLLSGNWWPRDPKVLEVLLASSWFNT